MIHQIYLKLNVILLARNPIFVKKLFWRREKSCYFFLPLDEENVLCVDNFSRSQMFNGSKKVNKFELYNFFNLSFIRGLILSSFSQGDSYSLNMTRNTCVTLNLYVFIKIFLVEFVGYCEYWIFFLKLDTICSLQ